MPYSKKQMDAEIALIYRNPENWMWEKTKDQSSLPSRWKKNDASKRWELTSHVQAGGKVDLKTMQQYCWVAYDKAYRAVNRQHIGRSWDLSPQLRQKKSNLADADVSLLDDSTFGNILQMGKWASVVNDAWMLGGINRVAKFELHSARSKANLWTNNYGSGFVVTARELTGLVHFGYQLVGETHGGGEMYVATDWKRAKEATLEDYHLAVALQESMGESGGIVHIRNHSL